MKLSDFDYTLPDECIARYPLEKRSDSRLLVLDRKTGDIAHQHFYDLAEHLEAGDLLVFNDSRVIPARLYGKKATGGKVEILIERILSPTEALAHVKASHLKVGQQIFIDESLYFEVTAHARLYQLKLHQLAGSGSIDLAQVLEKFGHIPLPPYMSRPEEAADKLRYQTLYAREAGSVAAPTAGLHFDEALLNRLKAKGVRFAYVTLHVGAGTFQPIKVDNILEHEMHSELITLPQATVDLIVETKAAGKRVIAVGTTSTRTLEGVVQKEGKLSAYFGETNIFIYPGFRFKVIDGLVTNFHLPKSSLLMLVSAFCSKDLIFKAYNLAIAAQYRFFSYGDGMLIIGDKKNEEVLPA